MSSLAEFNFAVFVFGVLIAILNPVGVLPQFISFTEGLNHQELISTTKKAVLIAGSILVIIGFTGSIILKFFMITASSFKIAGGIILFKISLDMLYVRTMRSVTSQREFAEGVKKEDISVFPLAIPLIAGPGSITTVIMLEGKAHSAIEYFIIAAALITCISILYFVLLQAEKIYSILGHIGMNVMTRLMGLILAAIATQFIINSIVEIAELYFR